MDLEPNQKIIKIEKKSQVKSGIDCQNPFFTKKFDLVEKPKTQISGVIRFCDWTKYLINFGDKISFFSADSFTSIYKPVEPTSTPSPQKRLLQEKISETPEATGPEPTTADEGVPAQNELQRFDPFVIDYNEEFRAIKDQVNMEKARVFHIMKDYDRPDSDPLNLFLCLFGDKGLLVNVRGSINKFVDFKFEDNAKNEVIVCIFSLLH